ncbi:hypothetical protein GPALN_002991 [Globodera pallida]|nr:hypothetical protein GPALN_002991 [Globodera pallida]
MSCSKLASVLLILLLVVHLSNGGPMAYGICQAGCAALVVTCYTAAGAVFGTVTAGVATAPALLGCNVAFGKCQAACWAALMLPTA